mgnify:CR=1 FL=1
MKALTRFDITQNKNMRKRADRKALKFDQYKNQSYIGDGIVHLVFSAENIDVVFLDDRLNSAWLVSECNNYIVGSGVLNKIYRSCV